MTRATKGITVTCKEHNGPSSWTAASVDAAASWHYRLPPTVWSTLEVLGGAYVHGPPNPALDRITDESMRPAFAEVARPVLDALEQGRGFAIVEPPEGPLTPGPSPPRGEGGCVWSDDQARRNYWLVGSLLGQPFEQNVQGTVLYDVKDTGQDVRYGARFSVTNAESSFHTDNSFGTDVLDYVGLLCLRTAKSGGRSQMVSGHAVCNVLARENPDALAVLSQPFHIDRRGGTRPGEEPTIRFPVIQQDGGLLIRYLRYWIEAGHEKVNQPLTPEQVAALNTLDDVLARPELRVEFDLRPGQMYFINNRWILHNRTAFEDHDEPERRRHLVRLWLQRRD